MKSNYAQPEIKVYDVKPQALLAGTNYVIGGAKESNQSGFDDAPTSEFSNDND